MFIVMKILFLEVFVCNEFVIGEYKLKLEKIDDVIWV